MALVTWLRELAHRGQYVQLAPEVCACLADLVQAADERAGENDSLRMALVALELLDRQPAGPLRQPTVQLGQAVASTRHTWGG